ncbi:hypothetical protein G6F37_001447 [Rhizopus arrhizus]|nr:hypothetical protein G6F38_004117 [Rhizopus arrhizus]KAG1163182.1 hypothetical protein G6F37_001447 [Rhizopus arrhizus]
MSTSATRFYSSNVTDFEKMEVSKDNWEEELKKLEDFTCVHWINKGVKKYVYHRAPDTYVSKARTNEDNGRSVQKNSKKIGCNAIIMVICRISDPSIVEFTRKNDHNHILEFYSDLQPMSISDTLRDKIKNFVCKGFSRREVRSCLLQEMEEDEQQRGKVFHYDDIYNVWLMVAKDMFQFNNNEFVSLQSWKRKPIDCGYKVIDHSLDNYFSLDSAFGASSRSNEVLYSLVVRHSDTEKGVPVDYLLINDQSVAPVLEWLKLFRDNCSMQPEQITVDCSIPEADAIRANFGENCRIQSCFLHVAQCWSRNLETKAKNQPGQYNNTKVIRGNIMSELQSVMYEAVCESMVEKVSQFREKWTLVQPKFVEYLEDRWLALEGYKKWSAVNVIEEHRNMRTDNYIESWHNQLKSVYLKRIKNRRLDRLVFILTNDVERICSEIGRMRPELRRRRQREVVADSIPEDRVIEMISKDGDAQYTTKLFNQENILYVVKINEDRKIASCSPCYFKFNSVVCKHMYLLKKHISVEVDVLSRMETLLSQASIPILADASVNNNISDSVSSQDVERSILKRNVRLELDSFRHLKRSITAISDHDILDNVYKKLKEIRQIIDSADNSRRMGTQRSLNNSINC